MRYSEIKEDELKNKFNDNREVYDKCIKENKKKVPFIYFYIMVVNLGRRRMLGHYYWLLILHQRIRENGSPL